MELPKELPAEEFLYHVGTKLKDDGNLVTHGGRVITATALAPTKHKAGVLAKSAIGQVKFEGMYYRKDIRYVFK